MQSSSLPAVPLREVRFQPDASFSVFEGVVVFLSAEVRGGAVGVVDVVGSVGVDGFRVGGDGGGEIAFPEGGVTLGFELWGWLGACVRVSGLVGLVEGLGWTKEL
jgi:hypothetical protein